MSSILKNYFRHSAKKMRLAVTLIDQPVATNFGITIALCGARIIKSKNNISHGSANQFAQACKVASPLDRVVGLEIRSKIEDEASADGSQERVGDFAKRAQAIEAEESR